MAKPNQKPGEPVMANCGHLGPPILVHGEWVAAPFCDECAMEKAKDIMPLDEALDYLAKAIPPQKMEEMTEFADNQRRRRPYRAWPGSN